MITATLLTASLVTGCFQAHLNEALEVNRSRLMGYAKLSLGRSIPISLELMAAEKLALLPAWELDREALPYQKNGVALLCDEFVPMSQASAAPHSKGPPETPPAPSELASARRVARRIRLAGETSGMEGVERESRAVLDELARTPRYQCLTRHLVESVARAARLALVHDDRALGLGLPSSLSVSERFIRLQLLSLPAFAAIDREAIPLQAEGIPILCSDVPPIPN
jgi:hypothetical protein